MTRFLTCTAVTLFLGLTPTLAADKAMVPGAADTSNGAARQSSAPPGSQSNRRAFAGLPKTNSRLFVVAKVALHHPAWAD